jgi:hypothetical protein
LPKKITNHSTLILRISRTGQGWSIGFSVVWNSMASAFTIQRPPGSINWCIGCVGMKASASAFGLGNAIVPDGIFDSTNNMVVPNSLYATQLAQRLGKSVTVSTVKPKTNTTNPLTPGDEVALLNDNAANTSSNSSNSSSNSKIITITIPAVGVILVLVIAAAIYSQKIKNPAATLVKSQAVLDTVVGNI